MFDKMRSVYEYKGSIKKLILKFKYSDRSFLAKDFSVDMYKKYKIMIFINNLILLFLFL
jgi:predicted amidophosphoribosyltransferase